MNNTIEGRVLLDVMDGFFGVPLNLIAYPQLIQFKNGSTSRALIGGVVIDGFVGQRAAAYSRLAPDGFSVDIVPPTLAVSRSSGFIHEAVAASSVVILTGGAHVSKHRAGDYGQDDVAGVYGAPDDTRDAVDTALLDEALKQNIPVVAVCRGLQIAAAYFNTPLSRVPEAHHPIGLQPVDHRVISISSGSPHTFENMAVASAHHGGVLLLHSSPFLEEGFRIVLVGPDQHGEVSDDSPLELVVNEARSIALTQFHPERMIGQSGEIARAYFQNFVR